MKNFDTFGVMIDCSRNAVPTVKSLEKFFSIISKMGYNCAMLYTEDTYEVENEPFFGYMRGKYSMEELRELDRYARSVGIELVPCIQTLAHLNAILRWDDYRPIHDCDDILLIGEERTYTLIENMFSSLEKEFSSRRVHIGMDEAHKVGLGRYLDKHGYENRYELLMRHLKKVCEIAKKHGFEPMMWDDMFFRLVTGGGYKPIDKFPDEIKNNVPDELTLIYWDYYHENYDDYVSMINSTKLLSDKILFAGGAWCWGGFAPHQRVSIRRNETAIRACIDTGVKQVILTMWGDNGGECPIFSVLPALMHAAACAQGMSEKEMKEQFRAITGESYDAMLALDLPNYIYGEDKGVGTANYEKNRLYNDVFIGLVNKNAPGADPSLYKKYARRLNKYASESGSFSYLFKAMAELCSALEIKFDLGVRTRKAYAEGNKEELYRLAEIDYRVCVKRINKFYKAYREQWYTVNKPYGFEVQDARLGGLERRIESCAERLIDFCDGKLDKIDELTEEVMYNDGGRLGSWTTMISACPV